MWGDQWLTAITVLLVLANVAILWTVYRARTVAAADRGGDAETAAQYVDEDGVECPQCGAKNDLGFRFCRECVGELPGSMSFADGSSLPSTRGTL